MMTSLRTVALFLTLDFADSLLNGARPRSPVPQLSAVSRGVPLLSRSIKGIHSFADRFWNGPRDKPRDETSSSVDELLHAGRFGYDPRLAFYERDAVDNRNWPLGESGEVGSLFGSVEHLQAILDGAGDRVVLIKFKREGCAACAATADRFEETAKTFEGRALCYLVDFDFSKKFCKRCGILSVPSVHIYHRNELLRASSFGPASYDDVLSTLTLHAAPEVLGPC